MKKLLVIPLFLCAALLVGPLWERLPVGAQVADAQLRAGIHFDWSMPATGCPATDEAIQQNLYQATAGFVRFRPGKSGRIILRCGVTPGDIDVISQLRLTWKNTDGLGPTGGQGHVVAQLKRINKTNGNWAVVGGIAIGSDSYPTGTPDVFTGLSTYSPHTMDFAKYFYYVEISIRRPPGSDLDPLVYGVALR